ncbi:FecR domain-containing protein [Candidatus Pelagibacter sp.]|nr:FecR domain-containing protein [Candidatus Pelagibacter sp.]
MINILNKKLYEIKYLCILFVILLNILNPTLLIAQEKIATVVKVQSNVHAINSEGEKRLLKLYDTIYLNEEIITNERSSIVIQYLDNSTVILKKKSSIKVTDFTLGTAKNLFLGVIDKGSATIESGKIAKDSNSKMGIKLPSMSLDIKGTRFNIGQKEDGSYDVGLSEDSFGNVGTINVSSAGTVKTLFDPKQVISINADQIVERPQTDIEKDDLDEVTQDFIDVKIINEEDIQKTLESQLFNGDIIDINNDGQIDLLDVKVIRESIVVTKQETIDFIVENSKEDNINFLSNVLNESDEKNVGQSIDKIFDTKNDLVTGVLTGLSNTGNKFITSSGSEKNNEIKEKIFTQLLSGNDQTEKKSKNIELMSKIITKSDVKSIENIVNIVKTSNASEANSNLSLQILSSVADRQTEEGTRLENEEQTQINRLIEEAVASAAANNNAENSALIANVITKSNVETITQVVDNVQTSSASTANSTFSLQILSSVADSQSEESISLENEEQAQVNRLIEEAVASAAANDNAENSALIANVITKSNVETITQVVDNVQTSNASTANSTFSLQILSSVADSQSVEGTSLENEEQTQVNRLIEEAVASATANNNNENSALIANVITKSNVETITQVVDSIKQNNTQNPNASLSLQVLSDVEVSTNNESITLESNKQTQINRLYEEALAAAAAEAAAILAAEEAAEQAAAKKAAAILAAELAAAEEAAAILAAEEAAILAEEEAAAILAAEEEAAQAIAIANANNLTAKCNAATANVQNILVTKGIAITNRIQTQLGEQAALVLYNSAVKAVKQFASPVTEEEFTELDQLKSTRDALKTLYDISVTEAEDASLTLTNLNITLATARTTRNTLCAQAAAAQSAANL